MAVQPDDQSNAKGVASAEGRDDNLVRTAAGGVGVENASPLSAPLPIPSPMDVPVQTSVRPSEDGKASSGGREHADDSAGLADSEPSGMEVAGGVMNQKSEDDIPLASNDWTGSAGQVKLSLRRRLASMSCDKCPGC